MKRFFLYGIILIVTITLVVLIYLKLNESNTADSPSNNTGGALEFPSNQDLPTNTSYLDKVEDCFDWYVNEFMSGKNWTELQEMPTTSQCFTNDYIDSFATIAESTGADPVLDAQDSAESWNTLVVSNQSGNPSSTLVRVDLGLEEEKVTYIVAVRADASGIWKIESIQPKL